MQKLQLERESDMADLCISSMCHSFAVEATKIDDWIYDRDLYKRSEHEYALGRFEVERRIAINLAHSFRGSLPATEPADFVGDVIDDLQRQMHKANENLHRYRKSNFEPIIRNAEQVLKRNRYFYLAVMQNRRWLVNFLSH